ncbi:MAG TPA: hypothetical protein VIF15_18830, partial [Polyangiaceae bacterium]
ALGNRSVLTRSPWDLVESGAVLAALLGPIAAGVAAMSTFTCPRCRQPWHPAHSLFTQSCIHCGIPAGTRFSEDLLF